MKSCSAILVSLLVSLACGCSPETNANGPKLDGVGILHLGSPISLLDSLDGRDFRHLYRTLTGYDYYKDIIERRSISFDYHISELRPSEKDFRDEEHSWRGVASLLDSVRVFYIPRIKVMKGYALHADNVILKFYQDSLYSIKFDYNNDIATLLSEKYGLPKQEEEVDDFSVSLDEEWETNINDVYCRRHKWAYPQIGRYQDYIEIENIHISVTISSKEREITNNARKELLNDF